MVGEYEVGAIADPEPGQSIEAARRQGVQFLDQLNRIDDHTGTDHRQNVFMEYARGKKMERERLISHADRVPGVGPAVEPDDYIERRDEEIDDLALALVAPAQSNDARVPGSF